MSSGKKQKKRKFQSPPPPPPPKLKPQLVERLQRLRSGQRDLWADDDDIHPKSKQSKKSNSNQSYILLSDSDEDRSQPRVRNKKARKKSSKTHDENINKSPKCLICSIAAQLSSENCCSNHLSILKSQSDHSSQTINLKYLPDKVMIVPITDEIVQKYLDPQQIHQLRVQTSPSNMKKRKSTSNLTNKATMTSDVSEMQHPVIRIPRIEATLSRNGLEPLASSIVVESATTTITPNATPSSTEHNIENTTNNEEEHIDESFIEIITIDDDDASDNQQNESTEEKPMKRSKKQDPWIPICDEVDNTLEQVLNQIDSSEQTPLEFTPATARRTNTEVMAALLPKIPLKQGRFRHGKPINNRTMSNAANEYRPAAIISNLLQKTTTVSTSDSTTINIEKQTTSTNIEQSDEISNQLLTPDETNQYNIVPMMTNENLLTTNTADENLISETGEQNAISSSTNATTPSRISYRLNPDGSRVSISRPLLPTSRQSPLNHSLRRTSTDVTPIQSNKQ